MKDCGVIIVAGGSGSRMGTDVPKQFHPLLGLPVIAWSLRFFQSHPEVAEIVVVVPDQYVIEAAELCAGIAGSYLQVVSGGERRQDSVAAGIRALSSQCEMIAIHDGARPFPPKNFDQCLSAARETGAAIFAAPVTDTIKRTDMNTIRETLPREQLWAAQTPQVFRRELIGRAILHCDKNRIPVTDDASAVESLGLPVCIVPGPRTNLKITFPEDWLLAETIGRAELERQKATEEQRQ